MKKPLHWLHGEIKTPPFTDDARHDAGAALKLVQYGHKLSMPLSRPMPDIGPNCHELRVTDADVIWRVVYRIDWNRILVVDVFCKKTQKTPKPIIDACKKRLALYDEGRSTHAD